MRVIAPLIGIAAVLLAAAGLIAFPASASPVPVVYGVPYGHAGSNFADGKVRPTGRLKWTGDGSAWFTIRTYSSWTATGARG